MKTQLTKKKKAAPGSKGRPLSYIAGITVKFEDRTVSMALASCGKVPVVICDSGSDGEYITVEGKNAESIFVDIFGLIDAADRAAKSPSKKRLKK